MNRVNKKLKRGEYLHSAVVGCFRGARSDTEKAQLHQNPERNQSIAYGTHARSFF